MKIAFSIINSLIAIIGLTLFLSIAPKANLQSLLFLGFLVTLFSLNTYALWRPFSLWVSCMLFFSTIITIPIINIIYAIAIPIALLIMQEIEPNFKPEQLATFDWHINIVSTLIFLSSLNIAFQAYLFRKKRKTAK